MGYTTRFIGPAFALDQPLTAAQFADLTEFIDRDHRKHSGYVVPSNYCQWVPSPDGSRIEFDGGEKFYGYVEWLELLIERFLKPWGRTLTGRMEWMGEDPSDQGVIHVKDNRVQAIPNVITKPDPAWKVEKPEPKW